MINHPGVENFEILRVRSYSLTLTNRKNALVPQLGSIWRPLPTVFGKVSQTPPLQSELRSRTKPSEPGQTTYI